MANCLQAAAPEVEATVAGGAQPNKPVAGLSAGQPDYDFGQQDAGMAAVGLPDAGQAVVGQPDVGPAVVGQPDAGQAAIGLPEAGQVANGLLDTGQALVGLPEAMDTNNDNMYEVIDIDAFPMPDLVFEIDWDALSDEENIVPGPLAGHNPVEPLPRPITLTSVSYIYTYFVYCFRGQNEVLIEEDERIDENAMRPYEEYRSIILRIEGESNCPSTDPESFHRLEEALVQGGFATTDSSKYEDRFTIEDIFVSINFENGSEKLLLSFVIFYLLFFSSE